MDFFIEILPLVEFVLEEDITDLEALRLIETPPNNKESVDEGWRQEISENQQMLQLDRDVEVDPFTFRLGAFEVFFWFIFTVLHTSFQAGDGSYFPVRVNRKMLLEMDDCSVLICKWNPPLRYRFFKNLLPELQITMCNSCFKVLI